MIEIQKIKKSFFNKEYLVINELNLELDKGDFCVVIGSNGSGKSTLAKCISGEYDLNSGKILINGKIQTQNERKNIVSVVTQEIKKGIISEMSILENIALSLRKKNKGSFEFYSKNTEYIKKSVSELSLNLEKRLYDTISSLSGGQQQMIATLMAFISNPEILILDEHTSALDPIMQQKLMQYTEKYVQDAGITTIMITHKLDDAIKYGNRLIMLHDGKIVLDISKKEKEKLKLAQLISIFHKYEDLKLCNNTLNEDK